MAAAQTTSLQCPYCTEMLRTGLGGLIQPGCSPKALVINQGQHSLCMPQWLPA